MMYPSTYKSRIRIAVYLCACAAVRSALYAIRFKHKGQANKQIVAHYACCLSQYNAPTTTTKSQQIFSTKKKEEIAK